jgi:hypothetical protein
VIPSGAREEAYAATESCGRLTIPLRRGRPRVRHGPRGGGLSQFPPGPVAPRRGRGPDREPASPDRRDSGKQGVLTQVRRGERPRTSRFGSRIAGVSAPGVVQPGHRTEPTQSRTVDALSLNHFSPAAKETARVSTAIHSRVHPGSSTDVRLCRDATKVYRLPLEGSAPGLWPSPPFRGSGHATHRRSQRRATGRPVPTSIPQLVSSRAGLCATAMRSHSPFGSSRLVGVHRDA